MSIHNTKFLFIYLFIHFVTHVHIKYIHLRREATSYKIFSVEKKQQKKSYLHLALRPVTLREKKTMKMKFSLRKYIAFRLKYYKYVNCMCSLIK